MKKFFLLAMVTAVLVAPALISAVGPSDAGLVPCGNPGQSPCELDDLKGVLVAVLNFIINTLAFPLAVLAITIGGVMLLISAGNPQLAGVGKSILWTAIFGLLLALTAKLVINFILDAIGFNGPRL